MKNIAQGIVLTIITILFCVVTATIGSSQIREAKIKQILATAVDNAVEDAVNNGAYSIETRNEFVAEVLEELVDSYYTESEVTAKGEEESATKKVENAKDKLSVEIMEADADKGILSIRATVEYEKAGKRTGTVSYDRTCVLTDNVPLGYSTITYKNTDGRIIKKYTVQLREQFPTPTPPKKDGYAFSYWMDKDENRYAIPETVTEECDGLELFPHYVRNSEIVFPTSMEVVTSDNENYVSLAKGDKAKALARFTPSTTTVQDVTWTSSNPDVATVDKKGNIKAVEQGETTITATSVSKSASGDVLTGSINVSVTTINNVIPSIKEIVTNTTYTKTITLLTERNTPISPSKYDITFESSNKNVATVNSAGLITVKNNNGFALIKATVLVDKDAGKYLTVEIPIFRYTEKFAGNKNVFETNYTGKPSAFEVECGDCEITYFYNGETSNTPFEFTDRGTYVVEYTVKNGDYSFSASREITVNRSKPNLTIKESGDYYYPKSSNVSFEMIENTTLNDYNIEYVAEDGGEIEGVTFYPEEKNGKCYINVYPDGTKDSTYTVKIEFLGNEDYVPLTITHKANIHLGEMKVSVDDIVSDYNGESHSPSVNVENLHVPDNAVIDNKEESDDGAVEEGSEDFVDEVNEDAIESEETNDDDLYVFSPEIIFSESNDVDEDGNFVNPYMEDEVPSIPSYSKGTHTVYYQVKCEGFKTISGSTKIQINPIDDEISVTGYSPEAKVGSVSTLSINSKSSSGYKIVSADKELETKVVKEIHDEGTVEYTLNVKVLSGTNKMAKIVIETDETDKGYKKAQKVINFPIGKVDGVYDNEDKFIGSWEYFMDLANVSRNYSNDSSNEMYYKNVSDSLFFILSDKEEISEFEVTSKGTIEKRYNKIVISDTTKSIGDYALCEIADVIVLPDDLTDISEKAFDKDTIICYNGELSDSNKWGAKQIHEFENGACKHCGTKQLEINATKSNDSKAKKEKDISDAYTLDKVSALNSTLTKAFTVVTQKILEN